MKSDKPDEIPVPGRNPEAIPPPEPKPGTWPKKKPEVIPEREPITIPPSPSQIPVPSSRYMNILNSKK